tara:strand:- start:1046 stop:1351 length:306 start_codon:yes stop_codon:yes gene_type:complete
MKIDKLFKTNAVYVVYGFFFLSALSQCNSCSHNNENKKLRKELKKEIITLQAEVDTLTATVISTEEMIKLIKEVPAWKTLRIEEISDKERISINALEEKEN